MARSRVPGLSSPALVLESLNRFSPSLRLRVLKRKCQLYSPAVTLNRAFVCTMNVSADDGALFRIDDRKSSNPRMRGLLHGTKVIFQERGIRGFFQGFVPTTARQAANSATRFSSYTTLKQLAEGYVAPGEKLGTASTFAIGGVAGLITV